MKMFANENLFEPIIDYLKAIGNDMLSIRDSGLSGISDDEVYQRACADKRVIITMEALAKVAGFRVKPGMTNRYSPSFSFITMLSKTLSWTDVTVDTL